MEGRKPRSDSRGLDRHADRRHRQPEDRRTAAAGRRARGEDVPHRRVHEARRHELRRRRHRPGAAARGAADHRPRGRSSTRSRSAAAGGVTPEQLRDRIAKVMPHQVLVETGDAGGQASDERHRGATSASSGSRCSCSPACRCSSAPSRSSTRSRSPSPSARASSGCCARSARRGGQILATVGIEALTLGLLGAALGLLGGVGLRVRDQRAVQGVRDRPAEHRHGDRDPHRDRRR